MRPLKLLHAADLHLDSPFEGLSSGKAAMRRSEQRELLGRLAALVGREGVQLVLLPGDLLDSDNSYYETGEELIRCLTQMAVPVFIAPGNHDYYAPRSPRRGSSCPPTCASSPKTRSRASRSGTSACASTARPSPRNTPARC